MTSFLKWTIGIALGLAVTGQLKSATLKMAQMAVEAQKHQISYGRFSRMLTAPAREHKPTK
jgi:hypothetical protein